MKTEPLYKVLDKIMNLPDFINLNGEKYYWYGYDDNTRKHIYGKSIISEKILIKNPK